MLTAKRATRDIPIVFVVAGDPVASGIVASLSRPGGNATGLTSLNTAADAKRLELLKEVAPNVTRAAILRDASIPQGVGHLSMMDRASTLMEGWSTICPRM